MIAIILSSPHRAGRLNYSTAFDLLDYIDMDQDYLPWKAASDGISFISDVLSQTRPAQKKLNVGHFTFISMREKVSIKIIDNRL